MIKKLLLLIICYSCNEPRINETHVMVNHETRIKSILLSSYDENKKKFIPSRERVLNYSDNNDSLEYIVLRNDKKIVEKHIAEYQDSKLTSHYKKLGDNEFRASCEYNQAGDITNYTEWSGSKDYYYENIFSYVDETLVSHKLYAYKEIEDRKLSSEKKYVYDSLKLSMDKITSSSNKSKSIKYTFNSKRQILSKTEEYVKYKINYEGDRFIKIEKKEGIETDQETTTTTIKFSEEGFLEEVIRVLPWSKEIFNYSYDENNNLSMLTFIEEYMDKSRAYTKYEIGPYNIKSAFVFPSWFVDCGIFNKNIFLDINYFINENELNDSLKNKLSQFIKYFPDYYVEYSSSDGLNWDPKTRTDFKFERVKK